jgi:signal transduction histidine kinase
MSGSRGSGPVGLSLPHGEPAVSPRANVLLVDDQPAKLLTYQAILQDVEANLVVASSGSEALNHLLRTDFAVILVDVCMPELDGFELAAMLREHPRFRRTAIIFISGVHLTELDRLKGYECGAVDYLPVPIVPEILRAKVNAFIELYQKTQELERLNRDLENRVAQRTAELEDANRRKDEFLAVLAHELRNPLAAIGTAAELVGFPHLPPAQRASAAGVIQRQVRHLARLIDDLVDVSRITRGVITLHREAVEVATIVAHALEAIGPIVDERRHELTVHLPDEPLRVHGDATRLAQVVANVLNNAAKFTEKEGRLSLVVERDRTDVIMRISDTGIGIPVEMLARVFELFAQADRPLDRASTGLGIGLALVRRLVEMHDGTVQIQSEGRGAGTIVTIRLPLLAVAGAPASVESPEPAAHQRGPARLLVVDDNVDAANSLAMMLRLEGHEVVTADNGVDALNIASQFRPEVVLLDLGMPKLNGYETAQRMRQHAWGQQAAIIALTGWGQPADRDRTLAAGFDAHLTKPVEGTELLRTVHALTAVPRPRDRPGVRGESGDPPG